MPAIEFTNLPPNSKVSIKGTLTNPIISFPIAEVLEWEDINRNLVYDESYFQREHIPWKPGVSENFRYVLGRPNILDHPLNFPKFFIKLKGLNYCDARGENIWFYSTEDTREDTNLAQPNFRYDEYQEYCRRILNIFSIRNSPFEIVLGDENPGITLVYFNIFPAKGFSIDKQYEMTYTDKELEEYLQWMENLVGMYEMGENN
jgi:hypothetical protein